MNIEDCPVVADALNCQQKTAEEIIHENGDYLLDAKGNQPNLMEEELSGYVKDELLRESMDCNISWLYEKEKWKALKCIGAMKTEFEKDERMALLYLQPRTFSGRTASSCPDGVGSRNDALVIGYSLW